MAKLQQLLFVLARELDVFGLPGLRRLRDLIYSRQVGAKGLHVANRVRLQPLHLNPARTLSIGDEFHVGEGALIDLSGRVNIGRGVTVSEGARIFTHDHVIHTGDPDWRKAGVKFSQLEIGDYAWIGAGAIIAPSVRRIGTGAVIAAGAVVTRDVEDMTIVAGVPAKPVGRRD